MRKKQTKNVVVIGGGTGTFVALSGLKKYPINLTAIVSMMDSGGSNRVIRDEFGLLPTSDIRQCIVALASDKSNKLLRELFTYRYEQGTGIAGMTFGNLFMAALSDIYSSQEEAIEKTCELFQIDGQIVPVTLENTHLVARYENGKEVLGEHFIDEPDKTNAQHRITELDIMPKVKANPKAIKAIADADMIILGPGDLYTSVICNLLIGTVASSVKRSNAKKVFIMNLMTKYGQTTHYSAQEHLDDLNRYVSNCIDAVVINKTKPGSQALSWYKKSNEEMVVNDLDSTKIKVVEADLIDPKPIRKSSSDVLWRSLIRHNPDKLARTLVSLL